MAAVEAVKKQFEASFGILEKYFSPSRKQEGAENPAQLVLFAEHAAKNGCRSVAEDSLSLFFTLDPPSNQFLIRAHLCKALLAAGLETTPPNPSVSNFLMAMDYIVKAVNTASKSDCYCFMVYNASVLLWQLCRPFQRPGFRKLFAKSLRVVSKAVEDCIKQEYAWKLELLMGLILCQLDAGTKDEASKTCSHAIHVASKYAPDKVLDLVRLQVSHGLGDSRSYSRELKQSSTFAFLFKLSRIKYGISYSGLSGTELEQKLAKLFKVLSKGDSEFLATPTPTPTPAQPHPSADAARVTDISASLLLELAFFCMEHGVPGVARECLGLVSKKRVEADPRQYLLRELLMAQLQATHWDNTRQLYSKLAVETRVSKMDNLLEILRSAVRLADPDIIQHTCIVMWNASLPLLQHNLRHVLLKPLTSVATALENIESLLFEMRLLVHFELAKILAQMQQLQLALDHLNKAIALDSTEKYVVQLKNCLHRFTLRANIYIEPEADVDKAAKLIEQCEDHICRNSDDPLEAILIKAGNLLAPKFFQLALDGSPVPTSKGTTHNLGANNVTADTTKLELLEVDNDTAAKTKLELAEAGEEVALTSDLCDALMEKGMKLERFQVISSHAKNHLAELNNHDAAKRCQLWADLAKIARKKAVWDVALTAAMFCLEYDADDKLIGDSIKAGQSKAGIQERLSSPLLSQGRRTSLSTKKESPIFLLFPLARGGIESPAQSHAYDSLWREESSLIRSQAEICFLCGECCVHMLNTEGLSLSEPPQLSSLKGALSHPSLEYNKDWVAYGEWAGLLTKTALKMFLKGAQLGVVLGEPYLVSNAAVYLWNYNHHAIDCGGVVELVPVYRALLACIKRVPDLKDEVMVVRVCMLLAKGIAKKWKPPHMPATPMQSANPKTRNSGRKSAKGKGKKKGHSDGAQVDPDSVPELKEAVEMCEYALSVSEGVPMTVRKKLLSELVQCKRLLHQPIPLGTYDISELSDGCTKHCQAVVAVEMISGQGNRPWEFPQLPSLQDVFGMVASCEWSEFLLELELCTRLAQMALEHHDNDLVCKCVERVLAVQCKRSSRDLSSVTSSSHQHCLLDKNPPPPGKAIDPAHRLESELLSQAYSFKGQALVASANGATGVVREALEAFLDSARFGYDAGNYEFVISASSWFWNSCLVLSKEPMERVLLRDQLTELLSMIASLIPDKDKKEVPGKKTVTVSFKQKDLILSLFGALFQAYIDKQAWEEGLRVVEWGMWSMPRAMYRDLLHFRVIFKSRQGGSVESDMIRFQDEPELVVSSLWHTAAANAATSREKLQAYQHAIQSLKSDLHPWIKVNYLIELGEWLYQESRFSLKDVLDQFQLAVHILLCLKTKPEGTQGDSEMEIEASGGEGREGSAPMGELAVTRSESLGEEGRGERRTSGGIERVSPLLSAVPVVPSTSTMLSMLQLEYLVRVHVMMAQLHGVGTQSHWDLTLAALGYSAFIWKLVYKSYSKFEENAKSNTCQRPPCTPKEWVGFQFPDQMVEHLRGTEDIGSLNKNTIQKPVLTLYYLDILVKSLVRLGLHPLTLPVLHLERLIVLTTLSNVDAFSKLLHMQISNICLDLSMPSEAAMHDQLAETPTLVPEDLASSHVEMQTFQAKKEALSREESRRTLIAMASTKSAKKVTLLKSSDSTPHHGPGMDRYQMYSVGEEVSVRELWAKQALLLIRKGHYSSARELLNHALLESEHFDDKHNLFHVHIGFGFLAFAEKDFEKAIYSIVTALELPCQLQDVWEGVVVLSEAVLGSSEYGSQHAEVLQHVIKLVAALGKHHRKVAVLVNTTTQRLKTRLDLCTLMELVESPLTRETRNRIKELCVAITSSTDMLLQSGCHRDASSLLQQTARAYRLVGERLTGQEHQEYLLKALQFYQKALSALQSCYAKVISVCHFMKSEMMPIEGELVSAQLYVVEILLLIFTEYSKEDRREKYAEQQKSSIQKVIDDYVHESPILSSVESEWLSTAAVACDTALNLLAAAYSMAKNSRHLKTKCSLLLSHCCDLISEFSNPDPPQQWSVVSRPLTESDGAVGTSQEHGNMLNKYSTLSMVLRQQEADASGINKRLSLKYVAQSLNTLMETISLAVSTKQWDVGMKAALGVVDIVGMMDPSVSSVYLAFYQSLAFSVEMAAFLHQLQDDPNSSAMGALLCQRDRLDSCNVPHESPAFQANTTLLNSYEVYRNLSVSTNHLDLLKIFPSNFRFIVLQHSPDTSCLYGAYLIPPQPPPPSAKKGQPPVELEVLEPVVARAKVSSDDLASLKSLMTLYRELARQSMGNCGSHSPDDLEFMLANITTALNSYLSDVLQPIITALGKENSSKEMGVVILADTHLLSLPLETLPLFQRDNISFVSRDFSLQMLQHRMNKNIRETSGKTSESKVERKKEKHPSPPSSIAATLTGFKYVLDPTNCLTVGDKNPSSTVLSQIHSFSKITGKWAGFSSASNAMDFSEWPALLKECTGLIYFGTERILSHLSPEILVSLSLSNCGFAMVMDSMSTPQSLALQSRQDMLLHKSEKQVFFEQPLQAVMLLSMVGVGTILANQWHVTVDKNLERTTTLIKELLSEARTVGKVHWLTKTKPKEPLKEQDEPKAAAGKSKEPKEQPKAESLPQEVQEEPPQLNTITYNCSLYGIPHLTLLSQT